MSIPFKPPINTRLFGNEQEQLASKYLQKHGLSLVISNYQCRLGEIDLVMLDQNLQLVFVEIRYRNHSKYGSAAESITIQKQRKLRRTAAHFLLSNSHYGHLYCRFDVIGISPSDNKAEIQFDWIKNAFS